MRYSSAEEGMNFVVPRLPAPWHVAFGLWRAKGLTKKDKIALLRFTSAARWMDWRLDTDCSVETLLHNHEQTERLVRLMWAPLCIAALNTPPERASARIFLNVLRDSLGASRSASDMLIPRTDLTALLPQAAANFVAHCGGETLTGIAIRRITSADGKWRLVSNTTDALPMFDGVVVATPASQVNELLAEITQDTVVPTFDHEPITTCYLQYGEELKLPAPFLALLDDPAANSWGQFVFDRGQLDGSAGLLAVVISASTHAIEREKEELASLVAAQLARAFAMPELRAPQWTQIITEKRATFSCTPDLQRPTESTLWKGLVLAGDYLASDYPATLESAVRSGVRAAALLDAQLDE
jgi:squalene-associated FAD-dependent desaturase